MRDITNQIVNELVDPSKHLSDILRKLTILAVNLRQDELTEWVHKEQEGYSETDTIPDYRRVPFTINGHFECRSGYQLPDARVPVTGLPAYLQEYLETHAISEGVKSLEHFVDQGEPSGIIKTAWPTDLVAVIPEVYSGCRCMLAWFAYPVSGFGQILSTIRNMVLSFILELQRQFPEETGTEISFRTIASAEVHTHYMTEIHGGIHGSNVALDHSQISKSTASAIERSTLNEQDFAPFIESLRERLASYLPDETQRREAESDIATVESQLKSPNPKRPIIAHALESIKHVLESGTGHLAAAHLHELGGWIQHFGQAVGQI